MNIYKKYFYKRINELSFSFLLGTLFISIADVFYNYSNYPFWVNCFSYATLFFLCILFVLIFIKKINSISSLLIFSYLFIINIYLPGFFGDPAFKQFVISSFTTLGPCLVLVVFIGFFGYKKHLLILSLLNISLIFAIYISDSDLLEYDITNTLIFIFASIAVILLMTKIKDAIKLQEELVLKETKHTETLAKIRLSEKERRIDFLNLVNKDKDLLISSFNEIMQGLDVESQNKEKRKHINEQMRKIKQHTVIQSHYLYNNFIEDSDFQINVKAKHPDLTTIELSICNLLQFSMTSAEIGEKLHKSTETIKWHRKRIRKKMKLTKKEKINIYLKGFNN